MTPEKLFHELLGLGLNWEVSESRFERESGTVLLEIGETPRLWESARCPKDGGLVVTAEHDQDPLPVSLSDEPRPQDHRQIAQRNVNLVSFDGASMLIMPVEIPAGENEEPGEVELLLELGDALEERDLQALPLRELEHAIDLPIDFEVQYEGASGADATVPRRPGERQTVGVRLHVQEGALVGRYGVVHLREHDADGVSGGVTFVLTDGGERQ